MAFPSQIFFITERKMPYFFTIKTALARPQLWNNLLHQNKVTENKCLNVVFIVHIMQT